MITSIPKLKPESNTIISGRSFPSNVFSFVEADGFQFDLLNDVLEGRLAGAIFRSALPTECCAQISQNFYSHPNRYNRGRVVPAQYVGAFHYRKSLGEYFDEVSETDPVLDTLFSGTCNVWQDFCQWLEPELGSHQMNFRAAEYNDEKAGRYVMRSWMANNEYSLLPHEDEAQCKVPEQNGFEIQEAANNAVVAANFCIENGTGGSLHYWNIIPDDDCRRRLGLMGTGHPYPTELLNDFEKQVINIEPGDLYCFNGKAIHAVGTLQNQNDTRSTVSFLMAKLDDETIIHWT